MVTVEEIRNRITQSGWKISERPVRNGQVISNWKLVAEKNGRTFAIDGATLLLAFQGMGRLLGVWK